MEVDAAEILYEYVQGLDNLPSEVHFLLTELTKKEETFQDLKRRIRSRDEKIQRFVHVHGGCVEPHLKEQTLVSKIRMDYSAARCLADEKIELSNKTLALLDRHIRRLEDEMSKLDMKIIPSSPRRTISTSTSTITPRRVIPSITPQRATPSITPQLLRYQRSTSGSTHDGMSSSSPPRKQRSPTMLSHPMEETDADDKLYCYCRQISYGDMVACDNERCPYEWFHLACVGITKVPSGAWYCSECMLNIKVDHKKYKSGM